MLKAVIFDFDGVITDSEILHLRSFNEVLAPFKIKIAIKDYYKNYLGLTDADCFKAFARKHRVILQEKHIETLMQQKKEVFGKLARTEGKIIEGVRDFLQMLKKNAVLMAICSGALRCEIELILEGARLRSFFDVIVSAEEVKKGKPHPDGFLLTLAKLNKKCKTKTPIKANECIVVEDSHWGLEAAKKAGMHTIAVTNSYDAKQLSMAEKIVARLDELTLPDLQKMCP
jgi:beta-phosphoglucomutase